ncbi:MAG: hypothetical protein LC676_18845 [Loktanella sp.]|nr:hypothetical protein [Loktanella sp.]
MAAALVVDVALNFEKDFGIQLDLSEMRQAAKGVFQDEVERRQTVRSL